MKPPSICLLPIAITIILLAQPHTSALAVLHHFNETLHSQNGTTLNTLQTSTMEAHLFENLSMRLLISSLENVSHEKTSTHALISFDVGSNTTQQAALGLISTANPELEPHDQQEHTSLHQQEPSSHHESSLQRTDAIDVSWVNPKRSREDETLHHLIPTKAEQKSLNRQEPTSLQKEEISLQKDSVPSVEVINANHKMWGNTEQLRSTTPPPGLDAPIHTAAPISSSREFMKVMVINGDEHMVLVDDEEQFRSITPPPGLNTPIHTADQKSAARDSTRVMVVRGENVIVVDYEQLRGNTPLPGSTPIHTAVPRSVARDSLQVTVINEHDVATDTRRQLSTRSTPPPGMDTPIHTAAQISLARKPVQDTVINDADEKVMFATPRTDAPVQKQASSSVDTQSMQVMLISDDSVIMIDEEQLGKATPPPSADTPIYTAASRSIARNSVQVMVISDNDNYDDDDVVVIHEGP